VYVDAALPRVDPIPYPRDLISASFTERSSTLVEPQLTNTIAVHVLNLASLETDFSLLRKFWYTTICAFPETHIIAEAKREVAPAAHELAIG